MFSAINPGGIRLGSPALTTRGFTETEFHKVAEWCVVAIKISVRIQTTVGKKLVDFIAALETDTEVKAVAEEVKAFARQYSIPGL
jgi:glycine hydroxymethyltransferase